MSKDKAKKEHLLVEYEMAQLSAEHHDSKVWTTINVVWGGSLVLMGFVINSINEQELRFPILAVCLLGMFLTVYTYIQANRLSSVKIQKYDRCKEIEKELKFKQHTDLKYPKRLGKIFFNSMIFFWILTWIVLIYFVISGFYNSAH